MPTPPRPRVDEQRRHVELLLRVARMYHEQGLSQADIAAHIGYSRPTVSRLLTEAKRRRMVRVVVEHPLEQTFELEQRLRQRFGVETVAVAAATSSPAVDLAVGRLAASLVAEAGTSSTLLALSNGTALSAVVEAMPRQRWPYSSVVQMVGSLGRVGVHQVDSPELCRKLAGRLGGTFRSMPVPIVLRSAAMADQIRKEEMVLTTLELAARSDIAVVGVGAVGPNGHPGAILDPFTSPAAATELRRIGAVGHVCGHFFDVDGNHLEHPFCGRVISMAPERLERIPFSMVVASGPAKVAALHSAMRTGLLTAAVTDEATAQLLLRYRP